MATQGGLGLTLKINTGSLTEIVDVLEADFPEQEKTLWEFVTHDSTSGYMERIDTGIKNLSSFEATILWDDTQATHAQVLTSFASSTAVGMSIADPAGQETIAFDAHIEKIGRISKTDEGYQCVVTFQPTGAPTIT